MFPVGLSATLHYLLAFQPDTPSDEFAPGTISPRQVPRTPATDTNTAPHGHSHEGTPRKAAAQMGGTITKHLAVLRTPHAAGITAA